MYIYNYINTYKDLKNIIKHTKEENQHVYIKQYKTCKQLKTYK